MTEDKGNVKPTDNAFVRSVAEKKYAYGFHLLGRSLGEYEQENHALW